MSTQDARTAGLPDHFGGLRAVRLRTGMSQQQTADAMGVTVERIGVIEDRNIMLLRLRTIAAYLHALGAQFPSTVATAADGQRIELLDGTTVE